MANDMKELVKAQREYIALLEKSLGEVIVLAHVHGHHTPAEDIKRGKELREIIKNHDHLL